jgi:hypothetical protein
MGHERPSAITKELSRNDTGQTGAHQAGILIPRRHDVVSFFPPLTPNELNPRHQLVFHDDSGHRWAFSFIYYNNKFFGGTRNEYRLTCMTPFLRAHNLQAGDTITLARDNQNRFTIAYRRVVAAADDGVLRLGSSWKVVLL